MCFQNGNMRKTIFFIPGDTPKREEVIRQLLEKIRAADRKQEYFNNVDYVQLRADLLESPKEFFDHFVIPLVNQCSFLTEEQLSLLASTNELEEIEVSTLEKQVSDQKKQIEVQEAMKKRLELLNNNFQPNRGNQLDLSHVEMIKSEFDGICDRFCNSMVDLDQLRPPCDSTHKAGKQYYSLLQELQTKLADLIPAAARRVTSVTRFSNKPAQLDTSMLRNYLKMAHLMLVHLNGIFMSTIDQEEQLLELAKLQRHLRSIQAKVNTLYSAAGP